MTNSIRNENETRVSILGVPFFYLALFGIFVAFIGFVAENAAKAVLDSVIDARFHHLPFISPYGLIVFAFHLVLGEADNTAFFGKHLFAELPEKKRKLYSNLFSYFAICATVFLGELVVGNAWAHLFGVELWNYTDMPLRITQFTCVPTIFGFGTGAYLIFKFLYTPLLRLLRTRVPYRAAKWIVLTLGVTIVLDTCFLMGSMMCTGTAPMFWEIRW